MGRSSLPFSEYSAIESVSDVSDLSKIVVSLYVVRESAYRYVEKYLTLYAGESSDNAQSVRCNETYCNGAPAGVTLSNGEEGYRVYVTFNIPDNSTYLKLQFSDWCGFFEGIYFY